MAKLGKTVKVITGDVRLSFCNLFEAKSFADGVAAKYGAVVMIPKSDTATVERIKKAIDDVKADTLATSKLELKKSPLHDGDTERSEYDEFKGYYYLNVSAKDRPQIVDRQLQPIIDPSEMYSGVWARVSINFYPYNFQGNKGVGVGLNNVQKVKDDDRFDGKSTPESEFEVLS